MHGKINALCGRIELLNWPQAALMLPPLEIRSGALMRALENVNEHLAEENN